MKLKLIVMLAAALAALAGCAGPGPKGTPPARNFDLGTSVPASRLTNVRLGLVRAVEPFESLDMIYRLAYRDGAEVSSYTESRWAAPPAVMLRTRLARATEPTSGAHCTLDIELLEFSQVFDTRETSMAMIEVRAVLSDAAARVSARSLRVTQEGAGNAASGGASALVRAADRLIADLGAWAAQQAVCRP